MIGLQAAGLSPNARAGRVDAIESTASDSDSDSDIKFRAAWSLARADTRVEHVTALETAGQQSLMIQDFRLSKSSH
jgi:hypothetical protein